MSTAAIFGMKTYFKIEEKPLEQAEGLEKN